MSGAVGIVWGAGGTIGTAQNIGDVLFLAAGLAWAGYTVAMRRARLDGLHAAAIAAIGSLVLYLPGYTLILGGQRLQGAARRYCAPGCRTGTADRDRRVAALWTLTALLAIPILGEWPAAVSVPCPTCSTGDQR